MHKYLIFSTALILLVLTNACSTNKKADAPEAYKPSTLDHEISLGESAEQNNGFAFDLWQQIDQQGENLFLSPYSISSAMGMAYTGAKGSTAIEMAKVMGFKYAPPEQHLVFRTSNNMIQAVNARKIAQLHVANALFNDHSNEAYLVPEFAKYLRSSFNSEMHHPNFAEVTKTTNYINSWVEKQTNERIKDIVSEDQIAQNKSGLLLVNSIYFKSPWLSQFQTASTTQDRFYTTSKKEADKHIILPMMKQTGDYRYAEVPEGQIIELPFEDEELAMIFMLPQDVDATSKNLDEKTWQSWMKALGKTRKVELFLPKFRLEQTLNTLPDTFYAMGMKAPFDPKQADFSGILSNTHMGRLYISHIVHKAFLEVSETGTEAAAATQIGFSRTSFTPPDPDLTVFRADKPFLCMIIHKAANEILFMGKVQKPAVIKD